MVLSPALELRLERILTEQTQRNRLQSYNLSPRRKILLVGPPWFWQNNDGISIGWRTAPTAPNCHV